ncbi:DUF2178 domain-containing protein [Halorussus pelagicus]|uniref:DUF2178 domain-containing protein n=1 Tax=Halorussus pelagicus TaxID=2505977 RepID=UPI001FB5AFC1|nr:DUF2178 domain-containing protein [Halorussus pelagicus]
MTQTHTAGPKRLEKARRYRQLLVGFPVGGAVIAIFLREILGYPLVSEAVYWVGIVGFLAVWVGTSVTLFDERDQALERRASKLTLTIFAPVLVVAASLARVLPKVSDVTMPEAIWPALYAFVALYAVFAVVYLTLRSRT